MIGLVRRGGWLTLFLMPLFFATENVDMVLQLKPTDGQGAPLRIMVGITGSGAKSAACQQFSDILKRCLEFEQRFAPEVRILDATPAKKSEVTTLFDEGFDAALFLTFTSTSEPIEWRLYDTKPGEMICGRRNAAAGYVKDAAYVIAARIIHELMAQEVPFLTKIAFIERDRATKKSLLCIVDYDGEGQQVLLSSARILVSPSWGKDTKSPLLVLSEFTRSNVRFIGVDMAGNKYTIMDQDGTSVGLCYAPCSDDVVYCRSGYIWRYRFDPVTKKGTHQLIIRDDGTCAFPCVTKEGDVIYCAGGRIKRWNAGSGSTETLIGKGYSVAPAYSVMSNKIVYSARVKGNMQLFTYDLSSGAKKQLTFDRGDKVDPIWSPCGNYVAFCWQARKTSRIAYVCAEGGETQFLTPAGRHCAYPSWSPKFDGVVIG